MPLVHIDTDARREYALRVIGRLPLDPPGWDVRIERHEERRSVAQNSRHWALCAKVGAHLGYTAADVHEFALCRYFGAVEQKIGGIVRQVPVKRSSKRNKKEFHDFEEATEAWAIEEWGIFLGDDDS